MKTRWNKIVVAGLLATPVFSSGCEVEEAESVGERNANTTVDLVRAFYTTVDAKSENLDHFFADGYRDHDRSPGAPQGASDKEVVLDLFSQIAVGFPDSTHVLEVLAPLDDNRVMVYWTFEGTHSGSFYGNPASGKRVSINGVDIFRVEGGQFVEQWHVEELMSLFAQIAPTPSSP